MNTTCNKTGAESSAVNNPTIGNCKLVIAGNLFSIQQLASKASSCETRQEVMELIEAITAKAGEARRLAMRVN